MPDPVTGTLVGGSLVSSIVSGKIGSKANKKAAATQAKATTDASAINRQTEQDILAENRRQFDVAAGFQKPYRDTGENFLNYLTSRTGPGGDLTQATPTQFTMTDLEKDPGYQFRLDEQNKAIERMGSAGGRRLSGRQTKELTRYGSDYASDEYGKAYSRQSSNFADTYNRDMANKNQIFNFLSYLTGIGQNAAGATGNAAMTTGANNSNVMQNTGNQVGNNILTAGGATAQGQLGSAEAWNNAIQGGMSNILLSKFLSTPTTAGKPIPTDPGKVNSFQPINGMQYPYNNIPYRKPNTNYLVS